jgi:hypothetical protein
MAQGWECPKCGGVYAPFVHQCDRCTLPPMTVSNISSVTTICLFCGGNQNMPPRSGCGNPSYHLASYTTVSASVAGNKDDQFSDAEWNTLEGFMNSGDHNG